MTIASSCRRRPAEANASEEPRRRYSSLTLSAVASIALFAGGLATALQRRVSWPVARCVVEAPCWRRTPRTCISPFCASRIAGDPQSAVFYTAADRGLPIMLSCVIVAQPGWAPRCKDMAATAGAVSPCWRLVVARSSPGPIRYRPDGRCPAGAAPARIAAGSSVSYAGIQIGFTFALAFSQLVCSLTNSRARIVPGILLGCWSPPLFICISGRTAPQLKTRPALYRRLATPRRPKRGFQRFRRFHRQRFAGGDPPGSRRTAGHVCSPLAPGEDWPMRATLARAEEIARLSEGCRLNAAPETLTRRPAAPNSCGATLNSIEQRRRRSANS